MEQDRQRFLKNLDGFLKEVDGEIDLFEDEEIFAISYSRIMDYGPFDSLFIVTNLRLLIRKKRDSKIDTNKENWYTQNIPFINISNISVKAKRLIFDYDTYLLNLHIISNTNDFSIEIPPNSVDYLPFIAKNTNLSIVNRSIISRFFGNIIFFIKGYALFLSWIVPIFIGVFIIIFFMSFIDSLNNSAVMYSLIYFIILITLLLFGAGYIGKGPFVFREEWKRKI